MVDEDKKIFWSMLNVTMELCNRPPLSKEAVISWWNILSPYSLLTVRSALDAWVDENKKPPSPSDIKLLCKPKPDFYQALPAPLSREKNKEYADNVVEFITKQPKKKTDYHAWFKRILANSKNYPSDSVSEARRVAREFGYNVAGLEANQ